MTDEMPQRWQRTTRPGVRDVASQSAKRIYSRHGDIAGIELGDLEQEALIALVTVPSLVALLESAELELGLVQHGLEQVLYKRCVRTEARRAGLQVPLSRIDGETYDESSMVVYSPVPPLASDYSRESVEVLLPAVWDEDYSFGLPKKDTAPDPDMPRGSTNPKTANNLPAYIADIKTGWAKAALTHKERRALLMRFGLAWTQDEIAAHEGVSQQTVSERLFVAVGKIVSRLNAGYWYELEGVEA